jgi:Transposase and inactivated derivatives, IS30 family
MPWKVWLQTITSDNGKEFAEHEKMAGDLNILFFFARPYHSWERGANENANGLTRQFFPKKTSFETSQMNRCNGWEMILNNRPRKGV